MRQIKFLELSYQKYRRISLIRKCRDFWLGYQLKKCAFHVIVVCFFIIRNKDTVFSDFFFQIMNNEQLQDWLTKLHVLWKDDGKEENEGKRALKDVHRERSLLTAESDRCHFLINYLNCSYTDVDLVMPLVEQLLSCYYKGGMPFICLYLSVCCCSSICSQQMCIFVSTGGTGSHRCKVPASCRHRNSRM